MDNGRNTYEQLKSQFDRTLIRHDRSDDGTARTTCLLVSGNNVYVGIAKFSNRTFNFSKKKGRAIAQGRAEHAFNVFTGETSRRTSQETRREQLSYTVSTNDSTELQSVIDSFFPKTSSES